MKEVAKMQWIIVVFLFFSFSIHGQESGYDKLSRNLDGVGNMKAGWFTVFCNLDVNFADARFSRFLQNSRFRMTVDDSSVKISPTSFSIKYVPRVSSKTEYIRINYQLDRTSKYKGVYDSEDGNVALIKNVEITGTPELILNLFITYWRYNMNVEYNKKGEIANYNVMGDHISLQSIDPAYSKIIITHKQFNYTESFGINKHN